MGASQARMTPAELPESAGGDSFLLTELHPSERRTRPSVSPPAIPSKSEPAKQALPRSPKEIKDGFPHVENPGKCISVLRVKLENMVDPQVS